MGERSAQVNVEAIVWRSCSVLNVEPRRPELKALEVDAREDDQTTAGFKRWYSRPAASIPQNSDGKSPAVMTIVGPSTAERITPAGIVVPTAQSKSAA